VSGRKKPKLTYRPGCVLIHCPDCGEQFYVSEKALEGPPELNIKECFKCGTVVKLLSLEPLVVGVVYGGPIEG